MEFHEIQSVLRNQLDQKRYEHTQGVLYTCAALCMHYDVDIKHGMLAGLLHDCGKAYKNKEQYELCRKYGINLTEVEERNLALIHAKLGAYLAHRDYGIHNAEIQSAIRFHTTGRPNMSPLEKILYIADYIEPHRELPMVEIYRKMAFQDLNLTMYRMLKHSLEHLEATQKPIDEMTLTTYQYYADLLHRKQ